MEWIRRHRVRLSFVLVISALISVAELIWARSAPSFMVEPWQLGVLMLPWFTTAATLLSLSYLLWFGRGGDGTLIWLAKVMFWGMAAGFAMMFVVIYGSHVFGMF